MSFVGGKLKLKGSTDLPGVKKKKKKSKDGAAKEAVALAASADRADDAGTSAAGSSKDELKKVLEGYAIEAPSEDTDRRTEAEKKHAAHVAKLEEERLRKMAEKSHRERINDFNTHLSTLSEHHDIPKVGPG